MTDSTPRPEPATRPTVTGDALRVATIAARAADEKQGRDIVVLGVGDILAIAEREGWRALRLPRGPFDVIELWIENTVMLELMTPDMAAAYRASTPRTASRPG